MFNNGFATALNFTRFLCSIKSIVSFPGNKMYWKWHWTPPTCWRKLNEDVSSSGSWKRPESVWHASCTEQDMKDMAQVVRMAQRIIRSPFPDLESVYAGNLRRKATCPHVCFPASRMDTQGYYSTHKETEKQLHPKAAIRMDSLHCFRNQSV